MSLAQSSGRGGRGPFEIHTSVGRDGYAVAPRGELDLETCDQLSDALEIALLSDTERVILDLRGLSFIDSSGLQTVFVAHLMAATQNKQFTVRRGPDAVQRVFEKADANQHLPMVD